MENIIVKDNKDGYVSPVIKFMENDLRVKVEKNVPELCKYLNKKDSPDVVIMHQDAYAASYDLNELVLLGMVIKYIGLTGKEIHIIGKNRETIDQDVKK